MTATVKNILGSIAKAVGVLLAVAYMLVSCVNDATPASDASKCEGAVERGHERDAIVDQLMQDGAMDREAAEQLADGLADDDQEYKAMDWAMCMQDKGWRCPADATPEELLEALESGADVPATPCAQDDSRVDNPFVD